MNEQEQAILELRALVAVPGALKIITNIPNPATIHRLSPRNPLHFILHDVERIEGPNHKGLMAAVSAEYNAADYGFPPRTCRDTCIGQPGALLTRLQQWRTEADRR